MRFILILIFVIFARLGQSQTLTQVYNEPAVGDTDRVFPIDTSNFTVAMPTSITGSNVTWNFSALKISTTNIVVPYVSPISVTNAASYTGCTVVQDENGQLYTFIKSVPASSQTEVMGVWNSSITLNFTNTAIAAKYPFSFNSTYTDNISGTFGGLASGTSTGSITNKADGLGTLVLPNGVTYNNVLRLKSVQQVSLTSGFIPVGSIKQTMYSFYHASQKFPVLTINYQALKLGTNPSTIIAYGTANSKAVIAGLNEYNGESTLISVYPQPAKAMITIDAEQLAGEIKVFSIYNMNGGVVSSGPFKNSIDISALSPGIYQMVLKAEKNSFVKKIVVME